MVSGNITNRHNRMGNRKRHRGHCLFGLVCVSLFARGSNGFVNLFHPNREQRYQQYRYHQTTSSMFMMFSTNSRASYSSSLELEGQTIRNTRKQFARLTSEEESSLLSKTVEYKRLNDLEKDMAMHHHHKISSGSHLPLLSVRAKAAGYGENLDEFEDAKYEGQLAREKLVTHNMGLVHYCVNQIIGKDNNSSNSNKKKGLPLNSLSREDLIQEGTIGLARAVDKWNPDIGGRFSTYSIYWVRAAILRCIAERDDLLRVPNHVTLAVQKINKAAQRLGWVLQESGGIIDMNDWNSKITGTGSSQSWKAANYAKRLAEEAGLSEHHFEEAMTVRRRRYTGGYVPFEPWMQKTSTTGGRNGQRQNHHQQHNSDENEDHDQQRLEKSAATEELRMALSKYLRPKEMEALSWRYGLIQDDNIINNKQEESITDRANRQFIEMEKDLFGLSQQVVVVSTQAAAVTVAVTVKTSKKRIRSKSTAAAAVTTLPPARGRFGEAMTFTEVGKQMQVSAEYTRILCHKALDKLQKAAEDGTLEPAFLC